MLYQFWLPKWSPWATKMVRQPLFDLNENFTTLNHTYKKPLAPNIKRILYMHA